MTYVIGVDLDNTIVSYDELIYRVALEKGLITADVPKNKKTIRDHIRRLTDSDEEWTRLQAVIYGPRMSEAQIIEGVRSFFHHCRQRGILTYIISHKTQFAKYAQTNTDLRLAALQWMTEHNFFEVEGLGFLREQVFFESTRQEKIKTIHHLGCTHFIDDLEEVLLDPSFPAEIEKILYRSSYQGSIPPGIKVSHSWADIEAFIFNENE